MIVAYLKRFRLNRGRVFNSIHNYTEYAGKLTATMIQVNVAISFRSC
jgi:hypothetical protein